jgi:hypothetical protein
VRLPVAGLADAVFEWLLPGQLLVLATALVSLVLRLRRASGEERQQVKWFVYTVVTVVLVFVTTTLALGAGYLFPLFGLIPVSVAVAVFKYRLYDIDRLINRTLVYGLLTALLIGVYAGLVFLLGQLLDRPPATPPWPWPPPPWPSPPVPAGPPPGPGAGRPALQPPPLRRRPHRRALQRPPPRPGRPRHPLGRAAGRGRPDRAAGLGVALAAAPLANRTAGCGQHRHPPRWATLPSAGSAWVGWTGGSS